MLNLSREELKELIKEAVRDVLMESKAPEPPRRKSPFLTLEQVAEIDRVHRVTVYKRARLGKIPGAKRHGRSWRVNREIFAKIRGLNVDQLP